MSLFDLTGRVALVTGGNGGIGLGMAKGLAQAGASVVIAGRNAPKNAAALEALAELGASCTALQVDVSNEAACRSMAAAAKEALAGSISWSTTPASPVAVARRR
jgi:2-dehydro-3-deoxy-D-gluconate 5-dehydrogenase